MAHLVHKDKRPLKCVIDILESRVSDAATFHIFPPQFQVIVPQFVAVRMKQEDIEAC